VKLTVWPEIEHAPGVLEESIEKLTGLPEPPPEAATA
jgi:hypothetical protein